MDTLSLCFILKDEAETIEQVIKSFWKGGIPIYQELVVGVDDSTSDSTRDIVSKYATLVFPFKWENDFSKARNQVIEKCSMDWIFMPDGHEFLEPGSIEVIERVLSSDRQEVWLISPYVGIEDPGKMCCLYGCSPLRMPSFLFCRPMFWRRKHNLRFKEPIHNYIAAPEENCRIMPEILLSHRQTEGREIHRDQQRVGMNLPGLKEQIEKDPTNARAAYYLANTYGDAKQINEAVDAYKQVLKIADSPEQRSHVRILLGHILCQVGSMEDRVECFKEAQEILAPALMERWDRGETYFLLGWCALGQKKYMESLHWFFISKDMEIPITPYFIYPEMYTWFPWDAIMDARAKLGDWMGALEAAKKILYWKPDCKTVQGNIKRLEDKVVEMHGLTAALFGKANVIPIQWEERT